MGAMDRTAQPLISPLVVGAMCLLSLLAGILTSRDENVLLIPGAHHSSAPTGSGEKAGQKGARIYGDVRWGERSWGFQSISVQVLNIAWLGEFGLNSE